MKNSPSIKSCENCRYQHDKDNPEFDYCSQCKTNNEPTAETHLSDNWLPVAKIPCSDCNLEEGIWEVTFLKKFRGDYGKKEGLFCDHCLNLNMGGYHSGGGWSVTCVEKVIRKRIAD